MSGHLRVVIIEAEGESAQAAIEAAITIFRPSTPAPALPPANGAALARLAPPAVPAIGKKGRRGGYRGRRAAPGNDAAASSSAAPSAAAVTGDAGVSVAGTDVSFDGKTITVTKREAQLAAELAKVMPSIGDRDRLVRAMWGRVDDSSRNMLSQVARSLNESVAAIGLKVTAVRGIGVCMAAL